MAVALGMRDRRAAGCETGAVARVKVTTEATGGKRSRRKGEPPPPPPKKSPWRFWKWYLAATVLVSIGLGLRLFLAPATDPVVGEGAVDAVVVQLSSGPGALPAAMALMNQRAATTLVIADGRDPVLPTANKLCDDAPWTVICPSTPAMTARDQARLIGTLATENGWQRVALVSGETRLSRASLLATRCTTATISRVSAPDEGGVATVATEAAGYLLALLLRRQC